MVEKILFLWAAMFSVTANGQNVMNATLRNPIEVTSSIMGGDVTASVDNWQVEFNGTGTNGRLARNTWSMEGQEDGTGMTYPFIENWTYRDNYLSDQFCRIDTVDIEPGAYRITALVRMYNERGADDITGGFLFGNFQRSAVTGEPFTYNDMTGIYSRAETYAIVGDDGKLTFGMQVEDANFNWLAYKDFHVYYLGKSNESVIAARDSTEAAGMEIDEETLMSKCYKDSLNSYAAVYKTSTSAAEIMTVISKYNAMRHDVKENMAAWKAFKDLYDRIQKEIDEVDPEEIEDMSQYYQDWFYGLVELMDQDAAYFEELTLTTQEVKDAYKELYAQYTDRPIGPMPWYYLSNRDFKDGWTDWTCECNEAGGQLATKSNNMAEAWNVSAFDVHQDATGNPCLGGYMPAGFYKLTMNGFYRYSRMDNAWNEYFNGDGTKKDHPVSEIKTSPVVVYMNDFTKPLANYFDYRTDSEYADENWTSGVYYTDPLLEYCYPEASQDISEAFGRGQYLNTVCCVIANDNDVIRVGVKGSTNQAGDSWAVFSNFKMTFMGYDFETGKQLMRDAYQQYKDKAADDALLYLTNLMAEIEEAGTISKSEFSKIATAIDDLQLSATAIDEVSVDGNSPSRTEYYKLDGTRAATPHKGINIIRTVGTDGKVTVSKKVIR